MAPAPSGSFVVMRHHLFVALLLSVPCAAVAQQPVAPPAAPAPVVAPAPAALPLAGPSALVLHTVKADKTAAFEAVMSRLRDLLAGSPNEARRAQASGWRVFRQTAPLPDGNVLFISLIDPVVANAEYDVARLIAEAAPSEGAQLYEQFRDAHVLPTVQASNMSLVIDVGAPAAPAGPAAPVKP